MLKRYKMYYSEAVGKIEMYLLCQKYHMSGCVQYEQNSEMMVELYGEERKIVDFMPIKINIEENAVHFYNKKYCQHRKEKSRSAKPNKNSRISRKKWYLETSH